MARRGRSEVEEGQAVYTPMVLKVYDVGILGVSCRWVWKCPASLMQAHYDEHLGARHGDVGVGTGYFLDRAKWATPPEGLTLVDLNPNSLTATRERVERFDPATVEADILQPLPELPHAPFDSVGVNFLLHCIPGGFPDKATTVFGNLAPHVAPGGVVFGSTILGPGEPHSRLAQGVLKGYNRKGIFHNLDDDLEGLTTALAGAFEHHEVRRVGSVALFSGRTATTP